MSYFDRLAFVLFEAAAPVADFRTVNGTDRTVSREDGAKALLESMERMNLLGPAQKDAGAAK